MSGRIRSIKPDWLQDERMVLASAEARVLSVALILMADDYGNGRANPMVLGAAVFPSSSNPRATAAAACEELSRMRYVRLYEVDGQTYYTIRTWKKHQRVDHPGAPKVPAPPDETIENDSPTVSLGNPRESLGEPSGRLATSRDPDPISGSSALPPKLDQNKPESSGSPRAKSQKRAEDHVPRPLGMDWLPTDEHVAALAKKHQIPEPRIRDVVPEFRLYWRDRAHTGQGKKTARGWAMTFTTRIAWLVERGVLLPTAAAGPTSFKTPTDRARDEQTAAEIARRDAEHKRSLRERTDSTELSGIRDASELTRDLFGGSRG
jgi:hypothetical protein